MSTFKFGRTQPGMGGESLIQRLRKMKLDDLKKLRWKDLTPEQRKKVIIFIVLLVLIILLIGIFKQNDDEAYQENINDFIKASSVYDVQATAKTTTSSAHQLIVGQTNKIKEAKSKGYKTKVNDVETKIASRKGNSMIGTTRVNTTEQIANEPSNDFTHLFIFQGQKVGASWKISNMLEAEAKIQNKKDSAGTDHKAK